MSRIRNSILAGNQASPNLQVCYYGSYDLNEPHNTTHLAGLRAAGVAVVECHLASPKQRDDATNYKSPVRTAAFLFSFVVRSLRLFFKLWRVGHVDAVIVGYPGYFDLPLVKVYAAIKRLPLLFNVHISLYETLVEDRAYFDRHALMGRLLKWYDKLLFRLADAVIVDTQAHGDYFARTYDLPSGKFARVFIGADAEFQPLPFEENGHCNVLFYGTFIPLQGIEHIIAAASILQDSRDVRFKLIGRGQTKEQALQQARSLGCANIEFVDWVTRAELAQEIARADICLGGQFGTTQKADLVIGYKCFQMLAMKKTVIVSNSTGNRELLTHGEDCLMCQAGDGKSLAEAILTIKDDPQRRRALARNAWRRFNDQCRPQRIGETLLQIAREQLAAYHPDRNYGT